MGRKISIAVFVSGCTEAKAKGLAGWALEHWNNSADTFSTFVDDFGKDEWTTNNAVLKQWVDNVAEVAATDIPFGNRLGNGNTNESRKELITELRQFKFNQKAGFKLVVDGGLMTGQRFKDIQHAVDRYLYKDGDRKALPDKTSTQASTEKTTTSKSTRSPSSFLAVLLGLVIGIVGCLGWFYPMLNEFSTLKELRTAVVNAEEARDNAVEARKTAEAEEQRAKTAKTDAEEARDKAENEKDEAEAAAKRALGEMQQALANSTQLKQLIKNNIPTTFLDVLQDVDDLNHLDAMEEAFKKRRSALQQTL